MNMTSNPNIEAGLQSAKWFRYVPDYTGTDALALDIVPQVFAAKVVVYGSCHKLHDVYDFLLYYGHGIALVMR